mmetsp:Transcript_1995/g.12704  ORF Transcript_1995/g.12704 Transcript_1995/m.12704 type:complete len:273 (-) Transcript_1995:2560-3378(-)
MLLFVTSPLSILHVSRSKSARRRCASSSNTTASARTRAPSPRTAPAASFADVVDTWATPSTSTWHPSSGASIRTARSCQDPSVGSIATVDSFVLPWSTHVTTSWNPSARRLGRVHVDGSTPRMEWNGKTDHVANGARGRDAFVGRARDGRKKTWTWTGEGNTRRKGRETRQEEQRGIPTRTDGVEAKNVRPFRSITLVKRQGMARARRTRTERLRGRTRTIDQKVQESDLTNETMCTSTSGDCGKNLKGSCPDSLRCTEACLGPFLHPLSNK